MGEVTPEILTVRADELRLGDVLDEGIHVVALMKIPNDWVLVFSNLSSSAEPAHRPTRVLRADAHRARLPEGCPPHTIVTDTRWSAQKVGGVDLGFGDLRIDPLS